MIKLQADPIPPPLMDAVVKLVPIGGEHSQMLRVSPGQTQAVDWRQGIRGHGHGTGVKGR